MDISGRGQAKAQAKTSRKAPPCALIIFGAGGDLTKRLLMPAIYNLAKAELLSERFAIIAVDRTPKPVEAFREYLAAGSEISSRIRLTAQHPTRSTSGLGNSSSAASSISLAT